MSEFVLKLYITDRTARSERAIANLHEICAEELKGKCSITVIDALEHPELAEEDKIFATPTLIKTLPPPIRRIIGDLSDKKKVFPVLNIQDIQNKAK